MNNYSIGIEDFDAIGGLKEGSNIMLIGPPMSGKEIILNHLMNSYTTNNETSVIIITTHEPATQIIERLKEIIPAPSFSNIGIVDCISKTVGDADVDIGNIEIVSSPADLTAIGVKISQFFEDLFFKKNIRKLQLHFNSLSTILLYSKVQTVFRFLHVLTGRIKAAKGLGIYVVDSRMHDEKTYNTLKQLCDGIIEIKSENDTNFIRIIGISPKPTQWFEYEIDGANMIMKKSMKIECKKGINIK